MSGAFDHLVRLGRDHSDQRFSATREHSTSSSLQATSLFRSSTTSNQYARITFSDPLRQYLLVDNDGIIQVLTSVVTSPTDPDTMLAMMGDHMVRAVPVKLASSVFESFISVLCTPTTALELSLPTSTTALDTLQAPPGPDGTRAPMGIDDLHFPAPGEAAAPVAIALPLVVPVAPGTIFPADGLSLQGFSNEFRSAHPELEVWRAGTLHAFEHNAKSSISKGTTLLMGNEIDSAGFGYRRESIVQSVAAPVTGLMPGPPCSHIQHHFDRVVREAHHRTGTLLFRNNDDVTNPQTSDAQSPQKATNLESALTAALSAQKPALSLKDQEALAEANLQQAAWRLFLAGPPSDSGSSVVALPDLEPAAARLFTLSQQNFAVHFGRLATATLNSLKRRSSDSTLNANITIQPSDCFGPWLLNLRHFRVLATSLNSDPSKISSYLTALSFAPRRVDSHAYRQAQRDDAERGFLLLAGETSSKLGKTSTTLPSDFSIESLDDVRSTVANLRAICLMFVASEVWERSYLCRALMNLHELLYSAQATDFRRQFPRHPTFYFNCIALFHDMLVGFFERAVDPTLRNAVVDGRSIATSAYSTVTIGPSGTIEQHLLPPLRLAFRRGMLAELGYRCGAFDYLYGTRSHPPEDRSLPGKRPGGALPDSGGKEMKRSPACDKGFLVWSGTGTPPNLAVFYPRSDTKKSERICLSFISKGLACTRVGCRQHHPTSFLKLPADAQSALKKEVEKHTGLAFDAGVLPAGTT